MREIDQRRHLSLKDFAKRVAGVAGVIAGKKVLDRISSRNPQQTL